MASAAVGGDGCASGRRCGSRRSSQLIDGCVTRGEARAAAFRDENGAGVSGIYRREAWRRGNARGGAWDGHGVCEAYARRSLARLGEEEADMWGPPINPSNFPSPPPDTFPAADGRVRAATRRIWGQHVASAPPVRRRPARAQAEPSWPEPPEPAPAPRATEARAPPPRPPAGAAAVLRPRGTRDTVRRRLLSFAAPSPLRPRRRPPPPPLLRRPVASPPATPSAAASSPSPHRCSSACNELRPPRLPCRAPIQI
nr:formin-like protein 16 [Aegilops tauschii subsp. strangulata]